MFKSISPSVCYLRCWLTHDDKQLKEEQRAHAADRPFDEVGNMNLQSQLLYIS